MERLLRCDCGFEVREGDDADLVASVQAHAQEAHGIVFTQAEALRLVSRAETDREAPGGTPHETKEFR